MKCLHLTIRYFKKKVPYPENGLCFIYFRLMSNHPPDMLSLADVGGGHNELCCDSNDPADMTWVQH